MMNKFKVANRSEFASRIMYEEHLNPPSIDKDISKLKFPLWASRWTYRNIPVGMFWTESIEESKILQTSERLSPIYLCINTGVHINIGYIYYEGELFYISISSKEYWFEVGDIRPKAEYKFLLSPMTIKNGLCLEMTGKTRMF